MSITVMHQWCTSQLLSSASIYDPFGRTMTPMNGEVHDAVIRTLSEKQILESAIITSAVWPVHLALRAGSQVNCEHLKLIVRAV